MASFGRTLRQYLSGAFGAMVAVGRTLRHYLRTGHLSRPPPVMINPLRT